MFNKRNHNYLPPQRKVKRRRRHNIEVRAKMPIAKRSNPLNLSELLPSWKQPKEYQFSRPAYNAEDVAERIDHNLVDLNALRGQWNGALVYSKKSKFVELIESVNYELENDLGIGDSFDPNPRKIKISPGMAEKFLPFYDAIWSSLKSTGYFKELDKLLYAKSR